MSDTIEKIARLCHEVNRIYCEALGDHSQVPWEDAPEWQRQSARHGVIYHMTHKDSTPADSHENWLKEKLEQGWVWGTVKDPVAKTHPCIRKYHELPKDQRIKDQLFLTVVRGMLA